MCLHLLCKNLHILGIIHRPRLDCFGLSCRACLESGFGLGKFVHALSHQLLGIAPHSLRLRLRSGPQSVCLCRCLSTQGIAFLLRLDPCRLELLLLHLRELALLLLLLPELPCPLLLQLLCALEGCRSLSLLSDLSAPPCFTSRPLPCSELCPGLLLGLCLLMSLGLPLRLHGGLQGASLHLCPGLDDARLDLSPHPHGVQVVVRTGFVVLVVGVLGATLALVDHRTDTVLVLLRLTLYPPIVLITLRGLELSCVALIVQGRLGLYRNINVRRSPWPEDRLAGVLTLRGCGLEVAEILKRISCFFKA
mmetsp:Transcript_55104/g.143777  ORF Transcript_55104/g.143777 Transcript_55104/m.143777 type:complete len:307 (-) Transcript_55104:511-1431(-)